MGQDLQFVKSFVILAAIKVACHCLIILSNMFIIVLCQNHYCDGCFVDKQGMD